MWRLISKKVSIEEKCLAIEESLMSNVGKINIDFLKKCDLEYLVYGVSDELVTELFSSINLEEVISDISNNLNSYIPILNRLLSFSIYQISESINGITRDCNPVDSIYDSLCNGDIIIHYGGYIKITDQESLMMYNIDEVINESEIEVINKGNYEFEYINKSIQKIANNKTLYLLSMILKEDKDAFLKSIFKCITESMNNYISERHISDEIAYAYLIEILNQYL